MPSRTFVALDLETTGLDPTRDAIIEIGAVRFQEGEILERFVTFVDPRRPIPLRIQQITGIRDVDVAGAPQLAQVLPELLAFVSADVAAVVAHNAAFDLGFLRAQGVNFHRPALDTLDLASILLPGQASYSLGELCHALGIPLVEAHRALDDAEATANLFARLCVRIGQLPAGVAELIVAAAEGSSWPPLLLFQDLQPALPVLPYDGAPLVRPPAMASGELLHSNGGGAVRIDLETVARSFTDDGGLARLMGPAFERRAGQAEMARRVAIAFNQGDHLLVEAGTGIGKTMAYLVPAALWSVQNRQRVVVATNTIALQDQLLEKDVPQVQAVLEAEGLPPARTALLKGRTNYLCLRRLQQWRRGRRLTAAEMSMLARVLVWLPSTQTGDMNELALVSSADRDVWNQICSDSATCTPERCGPGAGLHLLDFYTLARQRAEGAHILVVNHALLMADIATEGRVLPAYDHLVVDEAHRLEEAATDQLTYRMDPAWVFAMLRGLKAEGETPAAIMRLAGTQGLTWAQHGVWAAGAAAERALEQMRLFQEHLLAFALQQESAREATYTQRLALDGRTRSQPMWSEVEIVWEQAAVELRELWGALNALVEQLRSAGWTEGEPTAVLVSGLAGEAGRLGALVEEMEEIVYAPHGAQGGRVCWIEVNEGRTQAALAAAPLHIGDLIQREIVHKRRTTIFTGATLRTGATFRFIRERLGLWDAATAIVDSPFDYASSTLLFMPSDLMQPNHPAYQAGMERAIIDAAEAANGRTLALFTSMAHLRQTADSVRAPLERLGIAVYQQGNGSRHRVLREYRASERAALLGTRSFWEGIDLPGDQLSCLLIVRLPFAVPNDPLVAARSQESEDPFTDYMLPDAVLRFRQGFGRLIRRASDRGAVVLLDSRAWRKEYGRIFLDALPPCTVRHAPLSLLGGEIRRWLAL